MEAKPADEALYRGTGNSQDDSFYDSIDKSPQYDPNADATTPLAETNNLTPDEKERLDEEYRKELADVMETIKTLKTALNANIAREHELKRKLGITPIREFKSDMTQGIKNIQESQTVQKTNEKLHEWGESISNSQAYQKTSEGFKSFGAFATRKFGDMRNSNTFKSFEEKVGGAYTNVKTKVTGSKSEQSFPDAVKEANEAEQQQQTPDGAASDTSSPVAEKTP